MELLQLKYFLNTARKENISHVAQDFRVPPSTVSVSVKKLEEELGFKLFDRTSNSLKLNSYGKIFLRAVENVENEIKKAKIDMFKLSKTITGEIRLLILVNRQIVSDVIAKFNSDYPNVVFNIKHADDTKNLSYNNFDIVISDRNIEVSTFEKHNFIREPVFLGVHHKSPLSKCDCVNLKNLRDEKMICLPKGSSLRDFMDKAFKKEGIVPEIAVECDDPHYIRKYVKMGLGVTFFPSVSWNDYLDDNIKLLKINDGMYRCSYVYLNKNSSPAAHLFAENIAAMINFDFKV